MPMSAVVSIVVVAFATVVGCVTYICKRAFDFVEKKKK